MNSTASASYWAAMRLTLSWTIARAYSDVYSLQSGSPQHVYSISVEHARATSWSPSGDMLAVATGNSLDVLTTGAVVENVFSVQVAWSMPSHGPPTGPGLAVTAQTKSTQSEDSIFSNKRLLRIYDVGSGRPEGEWDVVADKTLAWAPDGGQIAFVPKRGRHSYIGLRDVSTGAVLRRRRRRHDP